MFYSNIFYFEINFSIIWLPCDSFIILFGIKTKKKTFKTIHHLSCFVGHPVGLWFIWFAFLAFYKNYKREQMVYLPCSRHLQGYPQRMRLQRRLYKMNTVCFFIFRNTGLCKFLCPIIKKARKDFSYDRILKLTL